MTVNQSINQSTNKQIVLGGKTHFPPEAHKMLLTISPYLCVSQIFNGRLSVLKAASPFLSASQL